MSDRIPEACDLLIEAGWVVIRDSCASGHAPSCDLVAKYDK